MSGNRMGMSHMNGNSRRPNINRMPPSNDRTGTGGCNSQHDELIKYIIDSWNKVSQEMDTNSETSVLFYKEQENQNLKDFQPFDLAGFWARRLVNYEQSQNS